MGNKKNKNNTFSQLTRLKKNFVKKKMIFKVKNNEKFKGNDKHTLTNRK